MQETEIIDKLKELSSLAEVELNKDINTKDSMMWKQLQVMIASLLENLDSGEVTKVRPVSTTK